MRRTIAFVVILALAATLAGCHRLVPEDDEPVAVYATFWPVYALTDAVTRDVPDLSLRLLVQPQDGCLRDYQLSDWDAALLSRGAKAVVMGGRGLESFESTLFAWGERGPAVAALLYNLELYNQDDRASDDAESHLRGPNPHLYMSLEGAKTIVASAAAVMQSLDAAYAAQYAANAADAEAKLDALLAENRATLADIEGMPVILMNEALVYVARDYDLNVAAWIDRESGESFIGTELDTCLETLRASGANVILIEKHAPQNLTEALEAAGYAVARIDVLSTHREGEGFDAYLQIQADNARALRDAFDRAAAREATN